MGAVGGRWLDLSLKRNWTGQETEFKSELGGITIALFFRVSATDFPPISSPMGPPGLSRPCGLRGHPVLWHIPTSVTNLVCVVVVGFPCFVFNFLGDAPCSS